MQTVNEIESALSNHPFLSGLDTEYLSRIASWSKKMEFAEDEYLCRSRHSADRLYLTTAGCVALGLDHPSKGLQVVQTLDAPAVVGISWLSPPYESCYDGKAVTPVEAIAIDAPKLRHALEEDCGFAYEMFRRLNTVFAERLQASALQLMDLYD